MSDASGTEDLVVAHYDADYFDWQSSVGMLSGSLNAEKFSEFVKSTDSVLDFGAGGGFLLASLNAARKVGVEINAEARAYASKLHLEMVESLEELPNDAFDVVVSNHALEHTVAPLGIAKLLFDKLKPGGSAIIVVPCERYDTKFVPNNRDQHLYTWSPMNIANLFSAAGFNVISSRRFAHRWPPKVEIVDRMFGRAICNLLCKIYAHLRPGLTQIRLVARKPLLY